VGFKVDLCMQADYLAEKKSKAKKVNNSLKRVKVYWN
jgi:hypothetical protein